MDENEDFTKEEKESCIEKKVNDIREITILYDSITSKGYKPKIDFKPQLIYECYLIDCPRHGY